MVRNSRKKTTMMRVAEISRSAALGLVDREWRRTGSRSAAYENVSQMVGMSSEWVRSFIAGRVKEPGLTVGFNLMVIYCRVCERIEQSAIQERELRDEIHEALKSIDRVVAGSSSTGQGAGTPGKGD